MPWIQFAFVRYLEVDQILELWDRIIGFDTLALLPILAAAIFVFRYNVAMQVSNADALLEIFKDGSQLKVISLLQSFIFF